MSSDKKKLHSRAVEMFRWFDTEKSTSRAIVVNRAGFRTFHKASDWPELQYLIDNKYVTRKREGRRTRKYTTFRPTQKWINTAGKIK